MAADVMTPTTRARLKPRHDPYWRPIAKGRYLGYRRIRGKPGTWTVRTLRPAEKAYTKGTLGTADDGLRGGIVRRGQVLTYQEAQQQHQGKGRKRFPVWRVAGRSKGDSLSGYCDMKLNAPSNSGHPFHCQIHPCANQG